MRGKIVLKIWEFINFIITFLNGFPTAIGKMPEKYLQKGGRIFNSTLSCNWDQDPFVTALKLAMCSSD